MARDPKSLDEAKRLAARAIANWRDAVLQTKWSSAKEWADKAGINPTTITRNMEPDHNSTSKIENLHILARAAGLPSVLDFLDGQAEIAEAVPPVPTVDELAEMIQSAMHELPVGVTYADYPTAVSASLRDQLEQFLIAGGSKSSSDEGTAPGKGALPRAPTRRDAAE